MYVTKETEYQNNPVIKSKIEVLTGGATVAAADFDTTVNTELKAGAIVGEDSNGLFHALKTAKAHAAIGASDTDLQVKKNHGFKVGDYITDSALALAAYAITAIDYSNDDYDVITVGTAIGALAINGILVKAAAEATAGNAAYAYTAKGMTTNPVDLTKANQPAGVLLRGSVNESNMPQYVDATIKALLPLILFQ